MTLLSLLLLFVGKSRTIHAWSAHFIGGLALDAVLLWLIVYVNA